MNGEMMKHKYIYIATTYDKYELPIAVADTVKELSELTGANKKSIANRVSDGRSHFYRVEVNEE